MHGARTLTLASVTLLAACAATREFTFFTPVPPSAEAIRAFTDTVPVRRHDPDSISIPGAQLVSDLIHHADSAGHNAIRDALKALYTSLPDSVRASEVERGSQNNSIVRRVSAQRLVLRLDLMRADLVAIGDARVDTVSHPSPAGNAVEDWTVVVLDGVALRIKER